MNNSSTLVRSWPLFALLLIAAIWLYRTPYSASNLEITPDAEEYALAPLQVLETGSYKIIVQGRGLPPRYPPWFSTLVILPAYVLFGHEPGNAILPITLLAVAGIGFAYMVGRHIGGTEGGILAALAVLILPSYRFWSMEVMTDVPGSALMMAAAAVYLRLRSNSTSTIAYLGAGALVALTALFRPVFAAMLFPFFVAALKNPRGKITCIALLLAPMVLAAGANIAYNLNTFGSAFRNGYHYWVSLPMDYPWMVFSLAYIRENLRHIGQSALPILALLCVLVWWLVRTLRPSVFAESRTQLAQAAIFFCLTTVPILVFHLLYFFPSERFYLPMCAAMALLAGSMLGLLIGREKGSLFRLLLPALFLLAVALRLAGPEPVPWRRVMADRVRTQTPENAIVVSAIDPVYLGRMAAHGSDRRIVPISRRVEYASKPLVRHPVKDSRLRSLHWQDPRAVAIIRPQAEEAVEFVASEQMDRLQAEAARGTPVFLETASCGRDTDVLAELERRFSLVQRAPYLFQLRPR